MGFLDKIKRGGAETQIAIGVVVLFLVGIASIAIAASVYPTNWGDPSIPTTTAGGGASISCGSVVMNGLTVEKYELIQHAAKRYLSQDYLSLTDNNIEQILSSKNYLQESSDAGDEAVLIAVLWKESGFNPYAISSSGASGMGQFTYGTAFEPGFPEFVGGPDVYGGPEGDGVPWNGGPKYRIPNNTTEDSNFYNTLSDDQKQDVRFDTKRSIYATAHYLGNLNRKDGGDLISAYYPYSGSNSSAMNDVRNKYNELKAGGGCEILSDVLNLISGAAGSMSLSDPSFHLIDYTGSRGSPWRVRKVGIGIIENGGYNPATLGVTGTRSKPPCDAAGNPYGCWKYEIFRPKNPDDARQIIAIAEAAAEAGMGINGSLELSTQGLVSNCHYLIKYVKNKLNFEITDSSFEYKEAPSNGSKRLTIQPGDIVHFILEDGVGYSFNRSNNQHWAIGDY